MKKLTETYKTEIISKMKEKFGYRNSLAVPRIIKATINVGMGKIKEKAGFLDLVSRDIYLITGQKPQVRYAKKAISGFKIRQGDIVGLRATLRGKKMGNFLEKLVRIVLPRTKDFRGISEKSIDKQGNYTLAIREHIVFPEIDYDKVEEIYGMQISLTSTARKHEEILELMKLTGFPFEKSQR